MFLGTTTMAEESDVDISDASHNLVDIVFAVVVGQSINEYRSQLFPPEVTSLSFWALIGVYAAIILSWIGYHHLLKNKKYLIEETAFAKLRLTNDLSIVVLYSYLLLSVSWFQEGSEGPPDLYTVPMDAPVAYLLGFTIIFLLYIINDVLVGVEEERATGDSDDFREKGENIVQTVSNHGHVRASSVVVAIYLVTVGLYWLFAYPNRASHGTGAWLTVFIAAGAMIGWRRWIGTNR